MPMSDGGTSGSVGLVGKGELALACLRGLAAAGRLEAVQ